MLIIAVVMATVVVLFVALAISCKAVAFHSDINKIVNGMSFDDVLEILGFPASESISGDIKVCIWRRNGYRSVGRVCTVTFKDDKVIAVGRE